MAQKELPGEPEVEREPDAWRRLVETCPDLVLEIDLASAESTYANQSFRNTLGYAAAEVTGADVFTLVHPDDVAAAREKFAEAIASLRPLEHTLRFRHRELGWRWLQLVARPFHTERGELRLAAWGRDITDQRRMTRELSARAERQSVIAKLGLRALEGIDLIQLMRETVDVLAATLGLECAKVLELLPNGTELRLVAGVGWKEGLVETATVGSGLESQAGYTLVSREPVVVEDLRTETRFSGPSLLHDHGIISGMSVPIHGTERPYGVLGVHTRVLRHFSEDEIRFLQSAANVLALAVRRREAEEALRKSEEQLLQAQKMEAIGLLASGVAHDFNNLLSAIQGSSELILDRAEAGSPLFRTAQRIQRGAERGANLIRHLLAFSRKQVAQPRVLSVNVAVREASDLWGRLIGEDIDLTLDLHPLAGRVRIDPAQMDQVVVNLVVNAGDAMPRGGQLGVATSNVALGDAAARRLEVAPGDYVRIAVSDTGQGIAPDVRSRIFEPFFTTKAPGRGTGLGLSTVYGIVKQSGGAIDVESRPGAGATFSIYLPRAREQLSEPAAPKPVAAPSGGAESILLVEDDNLLRELLREVLEVYGYSVIEAESPKDALRIVAERNGGIDLVLTDVVMPRMTGVELVEHLHKTSPDMKVLFMSGYTERALADRGMFEASVALIQKPFSNRALAAKLRDVLDAPR
jgi:PAS domain S-box-containing protein